MLLTMKEKKVVNIYVMERLQTHMRADIFYAD